jgi:CHASE2 domain-containing sensor protein
MHAGTSTRYVIDRRHAWPWTIASPLLAVVVVFLLTFFDPFGFESATKNQSANIFYKIYAAAYPTTDQANISVVLLGDRTLRRIDEPWPPSHLVHGQILNAILSFQPAAVLVDIFFIHSRPEDNFDNTKYVIDKYDESRVPLFMVAAGGSTRAPQPARPEILQLADLGKVRLVSAEVVNRIGEPPLYPLHEDEDHRIPAALALYRSVCQKLAVNKCQQIPADEHNEMEVVWGLPPAPFNCERVATTSRAALCKELLTSVIGRTLQLLWEAVIPSDWRPTDPVRLPFHAAISTEDLLDGGKRAQLTQLLTNKVVVYGADVALLKDFVLSPVHGSIDGAFIHAMALDNLLTFGNRYIHRGAGHESFRREWTEFQPVTLMLVAALVIIGMRRHRLAKRITWNDYAKHNLKDADEHLLRVIYWLLVVLIAIAGAVEFFLYDISPINWLALLIVVHFAHWIEARFFRPEKWLIAA